MVIYKSLREFRTRLRNNQDRHGRKEPKAGNIVGGALYHIFHTFDIEVMNILVYKQFWRNLKKKLLGGCCSITTTSTYPVSKNHFTVQEPHLLPTYGHLLCV